MRGGKVCTFSEMNALGQKILAIGSGKGGVGKSTTALNIALLSAKSGKRTCLVDMDPLSNVGVILDIHKRDLEPKHIAGRHLTNHTTSVFPYLDILFFQEKQRNKGPDREFFLYQLIFEQFAAKLYECYDLIVMDLPAGIVQDETLRILPYLNRLVVVTNAEPTSHVSAGGYIKAALEVNSRLRFFIWNNKYEVGIDPAFNPHDLLGNYNHYAPAELLLPKSVQNRMDHVAYVPPDPALNLLKTQSDFRLDLLLKIRESLQLLYELIIPIHTDENIPLIYRRMLRYYLLREYADPSPERALKYCAELFSASVDTIFKRGTAQIAVAYVNRQKENPLRKSVAESIQLIDRILHVYQNRSSVKRSHLVSEIRSGFGLLSGRLLRSFAMLGRLMERAREEAMKKRFGEIDVRMLRNALGLCFFYFTFLKLLEHARIRQLLHGFIPQKIVNGRPVRDRQRQIMMLIKKDREYHQRYFLLLKTIFPILERQLYQLAKAQGLENILFHDHSGSIKRNAYLRLLSEIMHALLNGGLGVHVGIRFNKTAEEIQKGWERINTKNW